jgi:DNA-binding HxlR family transcriptional regulator
MIDGKKRLGDIMREIAPNTSATPLLNMVRRLARHGIIDLLSPAPSPGDFAEPVRSAVHV